MNIPKLLPKWIYIVLLITALLGFIDASFLTVEHYRNKIPPCTTSSCEVVLTSTYATVLGFPVALLGAIYYLSILVLLIIYFDIKNEKIFRFILFYTTVGFLSSIYFFIIQAFIIHSYCQYCLISALTSTILFIVSMYSLYIYKNGKTISQI